MPTASHALGSTPPHGMRSRDRLFERGDALGRYEVLFPLATGGRAAVYAARVRGEARAKRAVALKVMQAELAADEEFARLLSAETERAAHIKSPAVVALLEPARRHELALFVPMELLVGVSARELADAARRYKKPLAPGVASALVLEAARGLTALHEAGLVHGDLSAQNLLVGVDGRARITDFGVAGALTRASTVLHGAEDARLSYASPEQMRGDVLTPQSDLFSLGVVAWELFTGARLFDAPNALTTAQHVASMSIPHVSELRAEVPRAIGDVIARALERDTNRRTQRADVFMRELSHACGASSSAGPDEIGQCVRELCGSHVTGIERALARALNQPEGARASDTSSQRIMTRVRSTPMRGLKLLAGGLLLLAIAAFAVFRAAPQPEAQVARASAAVQEPQAAAAPPVAPLLPPAAQLAPEVSPEPAKVAPAPTARKVRATKAVRRKHHRTRSVKTTKQTSTVGARGNLKLNRR